MLFSPLLHAAQHHTAPCCSGTAVVGVERFGLINTPSEVLLDVGLKTAWPEVG